MGLSALLNCHLWWLDVFCTNVHIFCNSFIHSNILNFNFLYFSYSIYLFIYLFIYISIYLFIYLFIYLLFYFILFHSFFGEGVAVIPISWD